jgi:5-methylcytosine-specific restriction endonuclease McrA
VTSLERLYQLNPLAESRFPFDNRYAARLRQSAIRRGADPSGVVSIEKLKGRWEYYEGRCAYCGAIAKTFDHVKPIAVGGAHISSNLRPACYTCNLSKGGRRTART